MKLKYIRGADRRIPEWLMHTTCVVALLCGTLSTSRADEPMWGDDDPDGRFELLDNFDRLAVLDNATGHIWLGRPLTLRLFGISVGLESEPEAEMARNNLYHLVIQTCEQLSVAGVMGWRVPTVQEMTSIVRASSGPIGFGFNAQGCRMAEGLPRRNAEFFTITRDVASLESEDDMFRHVIVRAGFGHRDACVQSKSIEALRNIDELDVMCVWSGSGHTLPDSREQLRFPP